MVRAGHGLLFRLKLTVSVPLELTRGEARFLATRPTAPLVASNAATPVPAIYKHEFAAGHDQLRIERQSDHAQRHICGLRGGEGLRLRRVAHEPVGQRKRPRAVFYRGAFEIANIVALEPGRLSRLELTGGERRSSEEGARVAAPTNRIDAEKFTSVERAHCRSPVYFVDQLSLKVRRP
jgi:hypothetical protein